MIETLYFLAIMVVSGYGAGTIVSTGPYTNLKSCENAKNLIEISYRNRGRYGYETIPRMICLPQSVE